MPRYRLQRQLLRPMAPSYCTWPYRASPSYNEPTTPSSCPATVSPRLTVLSRHTADAAWQASESILGGTGRKRTLHTVAPYRHPRLLSYNMHARRRLPTHGNPTDHLRVLPLATAITILALTTVQLQVYHGTFWASESDEATSSTPSLRQHHSPHAFHTSVTTVHEDLDWLEDDDLFDTTSFATRAIRHAVSESYSASATCFVFQIASLSAFFKPVIFQARAVFTQWHTWSATASTLGYICPQCSDWSGTSALCPYCSHPTRPVLDFMDGSCTSTIQRSWPLEPP